MARPRILLADDHPDLLKALRDVMGELGEVGWGMERRSYKPGNS